MRIGKAIDYQGIPYYQAQMNEWVRSFAYAFNLIEQQGQDLNGNSMKDVCFFQMRDDVSGELVNLTDQNERKEFVISRKAKQKIRKLRLSQLSTIVWYL